MPNDLGKSLASMGIYVFDADYLYELLEEDDRDENSSHDFGKDLIPRSPKPVWPMRTVPASRTIRPDAEPYWRDVVRTLEALLESEPRSGSVVPESWICTIAIGQFAPTMNHYRQRNSCRIAPVATDDP